MTLNKKINCQFEVIIDQLSTNSASKQMAKEPITGNFAREKFITWRDFPLSLLIFSQTINELNTKFNIWRDFPLSLLIFRQTIIEMNR